MINDSRFLEPGGAYETAGKLCDLFGLIDDFLRRVLLINISVQSIAQCLLSINNRRQRHSGAIKETIENQTHDYGLLNGIQFSPRISRMHCAIKFDFVVLPNGNKIYNLSGCCSLVRERKFSGTIWSYFCS